MTVNTRATVCLTREELFYVVRDYVKSQGFEVDDNALQNFGRDYFYQLTGASIRVKAKPIMPKAEEGAS